MTLEIAAVVALVFIVDALVVVVVTLGNISVPVALELLLCYRNLVCHGLSQLKIPP